MLLIECPYCGPRNEVEFHYGGEAHVPYPEDPSALSDHEWSEYLFYRANPKGILAERWQHSAGCRKWFNALRDTRTYRFEQVYEMGTPRPDLPPVPEIPADAAEPDRFAAAATTEGRTETPLADTSGIAGTSTTDPSSRTEQNGDHHG